MRKQKLWKSVMAVFTCAALMLSEPIAYAAEQEVSAQEEIGSEFQIEDGVLVKYTGNAEEVKVPDGVTSIGDGAFFGCESLRSIELPESVTSIGDEAFLACTSLSSIELSESVISIGNAAFSHCSSLTSINVASQNSEYASYDGYLYNKNLTDLICCPGGKSEVKLLDSLTGIGDYAFSGCSSLSSIELPESVTSIGSYAFNNCFLTSIELPEGVTSIGSNAFASCMGLTSIELPEGVTSIGSFAFFGCTNLTSINVAPQNSKYASYDGCLYNKDLTYLICCPEGKSEVKLLDSLTGIGNEAFFGNSSISSIELPENVTSIGDEVFSYCSSLTKINVASQNSKYASYDGCLYNKDLTHLIKCPEGKSEVKLLDSLTSIGDSAFIRCKLRSIELPEKITSIGLNAFRECDLSSIELPESVTRIGNCAFADCRSLSSIELPEGVTIIEPITFAGCSSLSSIELPEGITHIGSLAFQECSSLSRIKLPETVIGIGDNAFVGCSDLLTICCKEGSYAHQFAKDNKIKYELIKTPAEAPTETVKAAEVTEEEAKALSAAIVVTSKYGKVLEVEFSVTPVKDTGAADLVNADEALQAAKMKAFAVLDINITVAGKRVSLIDEKIYVNIPMDKIFADIAADTVVAVYRIDNGRLSFLGTSKAAADKSITFATEHFSPYVFVPVEDAEALKDVKVVNYLGDIDPSASVDIKSADIGLKKSNSDISASPATGDKPPVTLFILLSLAAFGIAVTASKKHA